MRGGSTARQRHRREERESVQDGRDLPADPQAVLRSLVIWLARGCHACGSIPNVDRLARELGCSGNTLKFWLRDRHRITKRTILEPIEWWTWRRLNGLAGPTEAQLVPLTED